MKGVAENNIVGYFTLVKESAKEKRIRGLGISEKIPIGLGTIYSWDFAFTKKFTVDQSPIGPNDADTIYFKYIGQAAQITTLERIRGHIQGARGSSSNKKSKTTKTSSSSKSEENNADRKTYEGLSATIKGNFKRTINFPTDDAIYAGDEKIVRVVHVASLFDLAALEAYMIKYPKDLTTGANTFSQMVQGNGLVGLNTLSAGVNAINAGNKTAGEAIAAAFYYLTEDDTIIEKAREKNLTGESMPNANNLLNKYDNDYKIATKKLFEDFGVDGKYRIESPGFNEMLNNFYKKASVGFERGIEIDKNQNIDINKKFKNAELKIIMAFDGADEQILKGMYFQQALKEQNLDFEISKKIYKRVVQLKEDRASKPAALLAILNRTFERAFEEIGKKTGFISEIKIQNQGPLESLANNLVSVIKKLNPSIKVTNDKANFFSANMLQFEAKQVKAGEFNYLSKDDIKLIRDLILAYVLGYIEMTDGLFPSSSEISNLLGFFKESNSKAIINKLVSEGLTMEEAKKIASKFFIKGQYTKK